MPTASVTRGSGNNPPASFPTRELQFPNEKTEVLSREYWNSAPRTTHLQPNARKPATPTFGHWVYVSLRLSDSNILKTNSKNSDVFATIYCYC